MRCVETSKRCEGESGFRWLRKGLIHDLCGSANKSSRSTGEGSLSTAMNFIQMEKDFGADFSNIDVLKSRCHSTCLKTI